MSKKKVNGHEQIKIHHKSGSIVELSELKENVRENFNLNLKIIC